MISIIWRSNTCNLQIQEICIDPLLRGTDNLHDIVLNRPRSFALVFGKRAKKKTVLIHEMNLEAYPGVLFPPLHFTHFLDNSKGGFDKHKHTHASTQKKKNNHRRSV